MSWEQSAVTSEAASLGPPLALVRERCGLCDVENADPVAVGEDFEYRTSADTFAAMRCRGCGLIYLNPRPAESELGRIYPANYHAFEFSAENFGLAHKVRSRLEAKRLLAYCEGLPDDARILDVGCGDGFHLRLLREYGKPGWNLEGIDTSERAVLAARSAGLAVRQMSIEGADFAQPEYDLVLLIATVEHVANPLSMLTAVRRALRPGGRVVVITDSTDTLDFRLFGGRHWGGYHFPRHWNLFDKPSLRRLAERSGLEVTEISTILSPVNWVYSIRNRLVDRGAPRWLIEQFSLKAPLSLAAFTIVDGIFQFFGRGALLKLVARKS